jgi:MerR family copper efflux transcriptional regulator
MADAAPLNIGEAARASGVSAKMIRHYERIGLTPKVHRTGSGYRTYTPKDVHILTFIRHARDLGFSSRQIKDLLSLWRDPRRSSANVKRIAMMQVADLDTRMSDLERMKRALLHLASHCHGDDRPDCPILDGLAAAGTIERLTRLEDAANSRPRSAKTGSSRRPR